MFQNGLIHKVITKKSYLEGFLIFSPAVGHPGSTLRKILEEFFKKSQVRNSHYLFLSKSMSTIWLIGRGDACRDCSCGVVGDGGDGTIGDGMRRSLRNDKNNRNYFRMNSSHMFIESLLRGCCW